MQRQTNVLNLFVEFRFQLFNMKTLFYFGLRVSAGMIEHLKTRDITLASSFVKDIQDADFRDAFMVSYDVASLFTNILLSETIDLAVNAIFESNTGLDLKVAR